MQSTSSLSFFLFAVLGNETQCELTGSSSSLQDLNQPGGSVQTHQQLAGAQVGRGYGGNVVQHVQLVYILEGHLLSKLKVDEMQSLLCGQLILAQQLHQEGGESCSQGRSHVVQCSSSL